MLEPIGHKEGRVFSGASGKLLAGLLLLSGCLFASGCGTTLKPIEPVATRYIEFQCDPVINGKKSLAVDIIYITYVQELREVTALGPEKWFEAEDRKEWRFKESVVLNGGDQAVVELDPLILERTVLLVIYADYKSVLEPASRQVIVDFAGKDMEVISVQKSRLQPKNKSLRYVK